MGSGLPTVGRGLPTVGRGLPTVGRGRPAVGRGLPTVSHGLPTVDCELPTVDCELPTVGSGTAVGQWDCRGLTTVGRWVTALDRGPGEYFKAAVKGCVFSLKRPSEHFHCRKVPKKC